MNHCAMASSPLVLTREASPDEATSQTIESGLNAYNELVAPGGNISPLWIVGRDGGGAVQAGLHGATFYNWLFVRRLWVAEPYRLQGIGSQLLADAEEFARERLCFACYLDTFSFQAPGFYERHGYQEFARLRDFPPGHARIWFWKLL